MRNLPLLLAALLLGGLGTIAADHATPDDQSFVQQILNGNTQEIREARFVLRNSNAPAVKQYAQMMIDDHSLSNIELRKAARIPQAGANQNAESPQESAQSYAALQGLSGPAFNAAYWQQQVADHQKMLDLLNNYIKYGTSAQLKSFAGDAVSVVQKHYDLAAQHVDRTATPLPTASAAVPASVNGSPAPSASSSPSVNATPTAFPSPRAP